MATLENLDRRVRRTRRLMGDALVDLILEKGHENVSILEITESADVAYSTFFRHYDSIEELLMQVLEAGLAGVHQQVELLAQQAADHSISDEGQLIFLHVQDNVDFFRVLLESPGAHAIRKRVTNSIAALFLRTCPALSAADPQLPGRLAANHIATSLLSLIEWWVDQGMRLSPERMGHIYARLIPGATVQTVADVASHNSG